MSYLSRIALICILCFGLPLTAPAASLQPLGVIDAETLPAGKGEFRFGMGYQTDTYLLFQEKGTDRTRVAVPEINLNIGLGERVEFSARYELLLVDEEGKDSEVGSGDLVLATKINLLKEDLQLPAVGFYIATKLPNASRTDGRGTDETDTFLDLLVSRNFASFGLHANLGLAILGDPQENQDDKLHYALAIQYPLPTHNLNLFASVEGLDLGANSLNDRGALTGGVQILLGTSTVDLGASIGYRDRSEDWGMRAGLTTPFSLPEGW